PRKAHALTDGGKDALLPKMLDDQSDFAKPGGRRGDGLGRSLDDHRSIGDTVHRCILDGSCFVLPSQRGTSLSLLATGYISLRIPWDVGMPQKWSQASRPGANDMPQ